MILNRNKPIYDLVFSQTSWMIDTFFILCSIMMLGLMANIRVPLWPVPITLQTLGVFLVAFFFGSRKATLSIAGYIAAGILGFSVFAGYASGAGVLFGPTAGYIIGFLPMVFILGWLIERGNGRSFKSVIGCMLIGEAVLYLCGLAGLYFYLGGPSLLELIKIGLVPFIIGDILKIGLAGWTFPYLFKKAEEINPSL